MKWAKTVSAALFGNIPINGVGRHVLPCNTEASMIPRCVFGLVFCFILVGCATTPEGPVRIDGSSQASFQSSWHDLVATLSSNQQARLNTAILLIGSTKLHDSHYSGPPSFGPETLRSELNGKTYREIIDTALATGSKITGVEHHGNTT